MTLWRSTRFTQPTSLNLIWSQNTLIEIPRVMFNWISGHLMLKLTMTFPSKSKIRHFICNVVLPFCCSSDENNMRKWALIFYYLRFILNYDLVLPAVVKFALQIHTMESLYLHFWKVIIVQGIKVYRDGLFSLFIVSEQLDLIVSKNWWLQLPNYWACANKCNSCP